MKKLIIILVALFAAPLAHAQVNFGALDEGTHVASMTSGAEHGLTLGIGYGRMMSALDQPILLVGDLTLGWAEVDISDFRLRAGALVPLVGNERWKVVGGLASTLRGTKNSLGRMFNVGADASALAGYYAPSWFVAAEGGFDWALATYVQHGDEYRMLAFEDARDGWYASPGGLFRYGIQGGASFMNNDIILRVGKLHEINGDATMFPLYGTLTYDRRW